MCEDEFYPKVEIVYQEIIIKFRRIIVAEKQGELLVRMRVQPINSANEEENIPTPELPPENENRSSTTNERQAMGPMSTVQSVQNVRSNERNLRNRLNRHRNSIESVRMQN